MFSIQYFDLLKKREIMKKLKEKVDKRYMKLKDIISFSDGKI
jgi:hypothetical protein